ncbi:MAG: uracil-DNA glycosylase [Kiritimatiellia bacterium]|jgi:uracil-DNA glycosylase family 4
MKQPDKAPAEALADMLDHLAGHVADLKEAGVQEIYRAQQPSTSAASSPSSDSVTATLSALADEIAHCQRCALHNTRTNTVPGQGNPQPELMFIGEAPGEDEDLQGKAFVGRAGQLLTRIIEAMGFTRAEVFIGNILKCRPPNNRKPTPEEMQVCLPFLQAQIAALRPRVIVALGATAVEGLLQPGPDFRISHVRGKWHEFSGIPLMPTYHPSYLLRNPIAKKDVWIDMQEVLRRLGRQPPPRAT